MVKKKRYLITFAIFVGLGGMLNAYYEHERTFAVRLINEVPLNSSIEPVERLANHKRIRFSEVFVWSKATSGSVKTIQTPYGRFTQKGTGDFELSKVTGKFTGRIQLCIERDLLDDILVEFDYINGVLWRKDWGYLPG